MVIKMQYFKNSGFRKNINGFYLMLLLLINVMSMKAFAQSDTNNNILVKSGKAAVNTKGKLLKREGKRTYSSKILKNTGSQGNQKSAGSGLILRKKTPPQSTQAFGFSVFDADVNLLVDDDFDGYFSEFTLNFDVDYDNGPATVYAKIYYSYQGGDWTWFYTTQDFDINGNASSDTYSLTTTLTSRFPTGDYDFLIDIYESGVSGIVDTYSSDNDFDLANLPLEDIGYDSINNQDITLQSLSFNSYGDDDFDGFYHGFNINTRITNQSFDRNLKAVIYTRDSVSGWSIEHTTNIVWVNYNESVEFDVDGLWTSGFVADYYDFLIEIVDDDTGEVIIDFGPEYAALSQQPLESENFDQPDTVVVVVDEGYSSGSSGYFMYILLIILAFVRKRTVVKQPNRP